MNAVDLANLDPRNRSHQKLIDAAFGLPPAIDLGLAGRFSKKIHIDSFLDPEGTRNLIGTATEPFPWGSGASDEARATVELLLNRIYPDEADTIRDRMARGLDGLTWYDVVRQRLLAAVDLPDLRPEELVPDLERALADYPSRKSTRAEVMAPILAAFYWVPTAGLAEGQGIDRQVVGKRVRYVGKVLPADHPFVVLATWFPARGGREAHLPLYRGPCDGLGADVAARLGGLSVKADRYWSIADSRV